MVWWKRAPPPPPPPAAWTADWAKARARNAYAGAATRAQGAYAGAATRAQGAWSIAQRVKGWCQAGARTTGARALATASDALARAVGTIDAAFQHPTFQAVQKLSMMVGTLAMLVSVVHFVFRTFFGRDVATPTLDRVVEQARAGTLSNADRSATLRALHEEAAYIQAQISGLKKSPLARSAVAGSEIRAGGACFRAPPGSASPAKRRRSASPTRRRRRSASPTRRRRRSASPTRRRRRSASRRGRKVRQGRKDRSRERRDRSKQRRDRSKQRRERRRLRKKKSFLEKLLS